ncbi:MAG: Smr/MutS family protein [Prolixibacteraceae bacterium]|jgi:DNA mismatch repair protein MutS2|nr:Smr/MutS family protein [Prolixibacteraceae bacterium]
MAFIFPENFEWKIGFDKIREMLKSRCLSDLGREQVDELCFQNLYESIYRNLSLTSEFIRIVRETENFPTSYYFDLRQALHKIRIEGRFLEVVELFDLKRSLETISSIIRFLKNASDENYPWLKELLREVQMFPYVLSRIDAILTKLGTIKDNASPELARIRKELLSKQSGVSKKLHTILRKAQSEGLVDEDATVAVRDGRAVIPVSSALKRKLSGIVHDESATGKTAYIEPAEVVEMNNQIRELEYAEKREIINILIAFSNDIRPYVDELSGAYLFLGKIDFIRAKALLSIEMNAIQPEFENGCRLEWFGAVHPLLQKKLAAEQRAVVPLNIKLDEQKHILLISGPNAGGKSVCLKTVGLLQYMLQCGLLIPLQDGSKTGIFEKLFIDIGDEQSIENDLSTYSSHLLNMKFFVKNANEKTLVLIDEFGTGTEPALGGAIAEAILERLEQLRAFGVITTHYTNLKHFAASSEGIENGAMLYDSNRMQPLFMLQAGKPGSSFAFEIAHKIGLPEEIIEKAGNKVGQEHVDFDKHLRNITRDKRYWEEKRQRIRKVEKILDDQVEKYEGELSEIKKLRKEILQKAKEEAAQILGEANKRIENTIFEIRESQAEKERTKKIRAELESFKEAVNQDNLAENEQIDRKIRQLQEKEKRRNQHRPEKPKEGKKTVASVPDEWQAGDAVRIIGQSGVGEIIELGEKKVVVAFGQLRTTVERTRLERISNNEAKRELKRYNQTLGNITKNLSEKRLSFKTEIDIRGQRAEEAIPAIQSFIDSAVMLNFHELRILHGKGNGILKEVVRAYLKSDPVVRSFRDEHVDFGGSGITVVELDN